MYVVVANMFLSYLAVGITTSMVIVQCRDCKDYDLSASDQSFLMKHYLRTSRKDDGISTGKPVASGMNVLHVQCITYVGKTD